MRQLIEQCLIVSLWDLWPLIWYCIHKEVLPLIDNICAWSYRELYALSTVIRQAAFMFDQNNKSTNLTDAEQPEHLLPSALVSVLLA